ncbi:MAG: WD40 repeat domain-containing protein, partial [Pyrinomonadaceae bacterium]
MIRLNASRIFHIIGSPSASVRLAALLLFMTLAPAAALAQTPAPTQGTNPVAERGLTLPAGALQPSARPGSQTGNADKPELVLQTGYQFLGATGVVFSPDNRLLATITLNSNAVKLWETATGRELRTLASSASAGAGAGYLSILTGVSAVAFSADSRLLAAGGRDNSLTLWDVTNGRELRTFDAQAAAVTNNLAALAGTGVTALAFTPDGQRLISMGDALRVWDVATGRALQTLAADISVPTGLGGTQLAISPDGSQVALFRTALNNNEKTIAIIDLNTGREARSFKLPDDLYGNSAVLAFTSGGQVFAADVDQSRLKFWNVTAKEKPRTLAEFSGSFDYQTAFSPDGRLLALAAGGALKIWDT